jgi:hypothetical protein
MTVLLPFSDTVNRTGVIQGIEDITLTQGSASQSYPLTVKTRDVNLALANYARIAIIASGRWQWDDTNQTDYPVISTDIISGQQDYSFIVDGSPIPNTILDIYRVEISDVNGNYTEIFPLDVSQVNVGLPQYQPMDDLMGTNAIQYNKTANGIFLYAPPLYNYPKGLRIYVARTPVYFASTDTTKVAGIPDIFQEYLIIRPAQKYAAIKNLPQAGGVLRNGARTGLNATLYQMEIDIANYYSRRNRDIKSGMQPMQQDNR